MYKVLLIAVFLCIAELGFAKKKIHLRAKYRSPIPPIEVCIDGRVLELNVLNQMQTLNVLIEDEYGNIMFSSSLDGNIGVFPIRLDFSKGFYLIIIDYLDCGFCGDFYIE